MDTNAFISIISNNNSNMLIFEKLNLTLDYIYNIMKFSVLISFES